MTGEERVKMLIGEMVVNLQLALAEIEQLKQQLAAATQAKPKQPDD